MPIHCNPVRWDCSDFKPAAVYTDGGVIGKNPSPDGGTWAFVLIGGATTTFVLDRSGLVLPSDIGMDTVENNITETIAILLALETVPPGWSGTLYGDNLNSIRRAQEPKAIKKVVPQFIKDRMIAAVARAGAVEYVLLSGHPTKAELEAGVSKEGRPVSQWNIRADKLCCEQADLFRSKK